MKEPVPAFAPEAASDQRGVLGPRGGLGLGFNYRSALSVSSYRRIRACRCLFVSATTGCRMIISNPSAFLSPPFSNRRSLRSKCGLFQTEKRRLKQKSPAWEADPEPSWTCKHKPPTGKSFSCLAKACCPGNQALGGSQHILLGGGRGL